MNLQLGYIEWPYGMEVVGLFTTEGTWIQGDVFESDPQLCGWIGGPKVAHHRIQRM